MAKKVITESRTANYTTIDEIPHITTRVKALGFELIQAHHCHNKSKSYIISPKTGEPGLLYTNELSKVEEFLQSYEAKQLAVKPTTAREESKDTESGSKEEEAIESDDVGTEEE